MGGIELWANWPGAPPPAGELLQLKIVGQQQGVWQMEVLTALDQPAIFLPQLLGELGLDLSYGNLQLLRRYLQGKVSGELRNSPEQAGLCPLDEPAWQRMLGFVPNLTPIFLALKPLPCGLLVTDGNSAQGQTADSPRAFCWVLAADLLRLGPVRVVGTGAWPKFDLQLLAGQDCLARLQKTETELRQLLLAVGMELGQLAYRETSSPILLLPTEQDLFVDGIDLKL